MDKIIGEHNKWWINLSQLQRDKDAEKARKMLDNYKMSEIEKADVDMLIWGECILEIKEDVRCIRFGTEEYDKIILQNGEVNKEI